MLYSKKKITLLNVNIAEVEDIGDHCIDVKNKDDKWEEVK